MFASKKTNVVASMLNAKLLAPFGLLSLEIKKIINIILLGRRGWVEERLKKILHSERGADERWM